MKKRALTWLALIAISTSTLASSISVAAEEPAIAPTAADAPTASVLSIAASTDSLAYGVLTPGNSYTKPITIINHSGTETTFTLSIFGPEGLADAATHGNIAEWLILTGDTEYALAGEASTNVSLRVKVPKDASAGGQYASLVASNATGDSIILATISAIIDGTDLRYGGEIISSNITWFNLSPEIKSSVKVKNTGNVDFSSTAKLTIRSIFGGNPIFEDTKTATIYPGAKETELQHAWTQAPIVGLYNAAQTITYVNTTGEIIEHTTERVVIICPIWLLIVLGILILGAIALIIVLKFRKKSQNPKKPSKKPSWEQPEAN